MDDEKWIVEDASDEELRDCLMNNEPDLAVVSEAVGRMMDKIRDMNTEMASLKERTFKLESVKRPTLERGRRGRYGRGAATGWPAFRAGSTGRAVVEFCKAHKGETWKSKYIGKEVKGGDSDVSTALGKLADLGLIARGEKMGWWKM